MQKPWHGIRNKVMIVMIVISLLPVATLGLKINRSFSAALKEKISSAADISMDNMALSLSLQLRTLTALLDEAAAMPATLAFCTLAGESPGRLAVEYARLRASISNNNVSGRFCFPFSFVLITAEGTLANNIAYAQDDRFRSMRQRFVDASFVRKLLATTARTMVSGVEDNLFSNNSSRQLFFARNVLNGQQGVGVLAFFVDLRYVAAMIDRGRVSELSSVFLLDEHGVLLFEGGKNGVAFEDWGKNPTQAVPTSDVMEPMNLRSGALLSHTSRMQVLPGAAEWTLVQITPGTEFYAEIDGINRLSLILLLLVLGLILLSGYYLDAVIIEPVVAYSVALAQVRRNNMDVEIPVGGRDEILELGRNLVDTLSRLKLGMEQLDHERRECDRLELQVLSRQISPHFIRNTLYSIRVIAQRAGAASLAEAISSFAKIMDYIFQTRRISTVRQEIGYLEDYIDLLNLRYQDKFQLVTRIEDRLLDQAILGFLFQPIVENAIEHGFAGLLGSGIITLTGCVQGKEMRFSISDNGHGLKGVDPLDQHSQDGALHGLANVRRRVRLQYGKTSGVRVEPGHPSGVTVTLWLPFVSRDAQPVGKEGQDHENHDCG